MINYERTEHLVQEDILYNSFYPSEVCRLQSRQSCLFSLPFILPNGSLFDTSIAQAEPNMSHDNSDQLLYEINDGNRLSIKNNTIENNARYSHYRHNATETTSESGVSDLDTMTDTATRCQCCPYGYHIDVDFVRFLQSTEPRDNIEMLKTIQKINQRRTGIRHGIAPSGDDNRSSRIDDQGNSQYFNRLGQDSCYNSSSGFLNQNIVPSDQSSCASSSRSGSVTLLETSKFVNNISNSLKKRVISDKGDSPSKVSNCSSVVYKQVRQTLLELDKIVESYLKDLEKQCISKKKSRGSRSQSVDFKRKEKRLVISQSSSDENIQSFCKLNQLMDYRRRYKSIPNDLPGISNFRRLPPPPQVEPLDSYMTARRLKPLLITESTKLPKIDLGLKSESDYLKFEILQTLNQTKQVRDVGINHKSEPMKPICVDASVSAEERIIDHRVEEIENIYRERIQVLEGRLRESEIRPEQRNVSIMYKPDVMSHCLSTDPYPLSTRDVFIQFTSTKETGDACIQTSIEPTIIYRTSPQKLSCNKNIQTLTKRFDQSIQASYKVCEQFTQLKPYNIIESPCQETQTLKYQNHVSTDCQVSLQNKETSYDCLEAYWYKDIGVNTALLLAENVVNVAINTDRYDRLYSTSGCQAVADIAHRSCGSCERLIEEIENKYVQVEPAVKENAIMTEQCEEFTISSDDRSNIQQGVQTNIMPKLPKSGILKHTQQNVSNEFRGTENESSRKVLTFCETSVNDCEYEEPDMMLESDLQIANELNSRDITNEGQTNLVHPEIEIDQSECLDEELYIACAILNEYLYAPNPTEQSKVRSALGVIQQDWFKVATESGSDNFAVCSYLQAFRNFSNFLLERIVNLTDANGNTALHLTICSGNWKIAQLLINTKVCDIDLYNEPGYTALMQAAAMDLVTEEQVEIFRHMAKTGSVNLRSVKGSQTALMIAVQYGKLDTAGMLLECGAQVNLQDKDGLTSLMYAVMQGNLKMVELILGQPDCDLSIVDNNNNTSMTLASKLGRKDILVALYAKMKRIKGFQTVSPKTEYYNANKNVFWSWRCLLTKTFNFEDYL